MKRVLLVLALLLEIVSALILLVVGNGWLPSTETIYQIFVMTSGGGIILLLGATLAWWFETPNKPS